MAMSRRPVQGRTSVPPAHVWIGARAKEGGHGLDMPFSRHPVQGGSAVPIGRVRVGPCAKEGNGGPEMIPSGSQVQGSDAVSVRGVRIRAGTKEQQDDFFLALAGRPIEGGDSCLARQVRVGVCREEDGDDVCVPFAGRPVQGGEPTLVRRVRVCARLEKEGDDVQVPPAGRPVQGGEPTFVRRVRVRARLEERSNGVRVSSLGGVVQVGGGMDGERVEQGNENYRKRERPPRGFRDGRPGAIPASRPPGAPAVRRFGGAWPTMTSNASSTNWEAGSHRRSRMEKVTVAGMGLVLQSSPVPFPAGGSGGWPAMPRSRRRFGPAVCERRFNHREPPSVVPPEPGVTRLLAAHAADGPGPRRGG